LQNRKFSGLLAKKGSCAGERERERERRSRRLKKKKRRRVRVREINGSKVDGGGPDIRALQSCIHP